MADDLLFFLSYARGDDEFRKMHLVRKFFNDLRDEVAALQGLDPSKVGYMDQRDLEPGDNWPEDLAAALGKCRTFIAIMSPRYFKRIYCGREWQSFEKRSPGQKKIIPVQWLSPSEGSFPEFAKKLHTFFDIEDVAQEHRQNVSDYKGKGLQHVMLRIESTHGYAYNTVLEKLAKRIVHVAEDNPLEPLAGALPDLKSVAPKFPEKSIEAHHQNKGESAGSWARFIIVAGTRQEMQAIRAKARLYYSHKEEIDWMPFAPNDERRIGLLAQKEALDLGLVAKYSQIKGEIIKTIRDAEEDKCVVIIVVDPWTAKIDSYSQALKEFDQYQFENCAVIITWNHDDLTMETEKDLKDEIQAIFKRRLKIMNPVYFNTAVTTMSELQAAIKDALYEINRSLAPHREPVRPVGASSFETRPEITSSR